ncbi:hypothetical protein [Haladaptatus caseinilyticus]|uniref:hypothetical protein n=1 Tax=Haladaptatus caseinilyticus TaxID=2993314 RepID=UPI00224AB281|nr:hypothetical protein [Haladaptatus caseinilyticus]
MAESAYREASRIGNPSSICIVISGPNESEEYKRRLKPGKITAGEDESITEEITVS